MVASRRSLLAFGGLALASSVACAGCAGPSSEARSPAAAAQTELHAATLSQASADAAPLPSPLPRTGKPQRAERTEAAAAPPAEELETLPKDAPRRSCGRGGAHGFGVKGYASK